MRWWMTRRVERQATRMHEVMERLDVDAAALARVRQGQACGSPGPLPDMRDQR